MKTNGLISRSDVAKANLAPHNIRTGKSKHWKQFFRGGICEVKLGSCSFRVDSTQSSSARFAPIVIDGEPIIEFSFNDGDLQLSFSLYDESGELALQMKKNRLVVKTSAIADYENIGNRIIVRHNNGILLDLRFEIPNTLSIRRARIHKNKIELAVFRDEIVLVNTGDVFRIGTIQNITYGFVIGEQMTGGTTAVQMMIAQADRGSTDRAKMLRLARSNSAKHRQNFQGLESTLRMSESLAFKVIRAVE